jgi:hypothetical protein
MIGVVNQMSLERANAFLAAVAARVQVGDVLNVTPAEIGRDLQMPDALSTARAVRALIARRRLEPASGSYRLLDARPLEPGEKESIARRPRTPRATTARRSAGTRTSSGATYSDLGRAAVDRLVELGQEASSLRATLRAVKEEARKSRDARLDAEQRADFLATKVRDLEARAEMAESNLRTLLAAARGRGGQRDAAVPDSEMEAILGVLKTGDDEQPQSAAPE